MDFVLTIFESALDGVFGNIARRWAARILFALLVFLAYCAPTRDIIWIANQVGQWKIGPFIHILQQTYHVPVASR